MIFPASSRFQISADDDDVRLRPALAVHVDIERIIAATADVDRRWRRVISVVACRGCHAVRPARQVDLVEALRVSVHVFDDGAVLAGENQVCSGDGAQAGIAGVAVIDVAPKSAARGPKTKKQRRTKTTTLLSIR